MSNEEAADREKVRQALNRRIRHREQQIASFGIEAPPAIVSDLEEAQKSLAALDVLERPPVSQQVIEVVPAADRERYIMAAVLDLTAQVAGIKRALEDDQKERSKRQHETDEYRIELERRLGNVRAGLLVNAVATVLGWVFRRRS